METMNARALALGVALVVAAVGCGAVRADDRAVAWARTFRNLAGVDFRAAGDVLGGGGDLAMGGLFERRVDAAAFFSTAFLFVQPDPGGFVAGFYNVWVHALVSIRFEASGGAFRVASVRVQDLGAAPDRAGAGDLEVRVAGARKAFGEAADALAGRTALPPDAGATAAVKARLTSYVTRMRDAFATAPRRRAVLELIEHLQNAREPRAEDSGPDAPAGLADVLRQAPEWRAELAPVFWFDEPDGAGAVVLAASSDSGRLVIVFLTAGSVATPIRAVVLRDIAAGLR